MRLRSKARYPSRTALVLIDLASRLHHGLVKELKFENVDIAEKHLVTSNSDLLLVVGARDEVSLASMVYSLWKKPIRGNDPRYENAVAEQVELLLLDPNAQETTALRQKFGQPQGVLTAFVVAELRDPLTMPISEMNPLTYEELKKVKDSVERAHTLARAQIAGSDLSVYRGNLDYAVPVANHTKMVLRITCRDAVAFDELILGRIHRLSCVKRTRSYVVMNHLRGILNLAWFRGFSIAEACAAVAALISHVTGRKEVSWSEFETVARAEWSSVSNAIKKVGMDGRFLFVEDNTEEGWNAFTTRFMTTKSIPITRAGKKRIFEKIKAMEDSGAEKPLAWARKRTKLVLQTPKASPGRDLQLTDSSFLKPKGSVTDRRH